MTIDTKVFLSTVTKCETKWRKIITDLALLGTKALRFLFNVTFQQKPPIALYLINFAETVVGSNCAFKLLWNKSLMSAAVEVLNCFFCSSRLSGSWLLDRKGESTTSLMCWRALV